MRASSNEVAGVLLHVAQTMISELDLAELMPLILDQLATLVQCTSASIMLIEGDDVRLVARKSALGAGDAPFAAAITSLAHVRHVICSGQPLIIDDTRADGRWLHRPANDAIRSWLGVPLLVKGQVIGLLNVSDTTVAHFQQNDVDILRTFAAFAAITLDNARLYALEQQARAAAEQAARAKAAFLANMSHEIRTPMNAVIGAASLLQYTSMTPEQQEYVATIHICGDNLLSVINEILDFSKFEAGQCRLEIEPFELHECIEDAIAIVATAALDKGIEISYRIDGAAPAVIAGDQARLRQVLVNLLGNAVKFTEQGEVTVVVDAPPASDTTQGAAALPAAPCTLHFAVQDSGIGIPADETPRLFEPFSQVDTTRTRKYGGAGLGLAICKRLVQSMNGSIWVTSEPDAGATFEFVVQVAACATNSTAVAPALGSRHVLLVAKDTASRISLLGQLHSLGLRTTVADALPGDDAPGSGDCAPDVLMMDANALDAEHGEADASLAARRYARWPNRVLLVGAASGMNDCAARLGFEHCLAKPVRRKALHKELANALRSQAPAGTNSSVQAAAAAPLHILLAEDNLENQKLIARMVKKLGHDVDLVVNGRQAVGAASDKQYDLVLMDLHMPELDGLEATRRIREERQQNSPRIIALTADALAETRRACLAAGMDGCLCKPLKLEQLARALDKLAGA